jgi:competence protein ComEA
VFEATADKPTDHHRFVRSRSLVDDNDLTEGDEDDRERSPRVRLAQLAAEARGQPSERSSPRHRSSSRRVARLIERWSPDHGHMATPPRRRTAVAAAVVGVLGAGVVTAMALAGGPEPERAPPLPEVRPVSVESADPTPASTTATPTSLVVSVVGTVAKPGLITVEPGARVADAIDRAGGARRADDLHTVNLARKLADGEQIYVGVTPPPGVPGSAAGSDGTPLSTSDQTKVDLNAADHTVLQTLPGVGEVTASRIVEWRERHGGFTSVEQLREIDGIGDKRFARLREHVSVG